MLYHQFQQSPFQPRISGPRTWLAMALTVALVCVSLFLLPFILLFGAIAIAIFVIFSRIYVARQVAKYKRAQANMSSHYSGFSDYQNGKVVRETHPKDYQGRTFEHQRGDN
ncbi:hypothetical protein [Shewanella acanthi]|uniref:hypothetical protein n=1 Tax=Shewanella acanthi TaxID=2864212 RepID=UPI001C65C60C|nr:hypothetical protein [Shewanella acanthi]QYJ78664.1 hypothetical protein K0H61_16545 [Shewanella acanthi]